ncbi:sodium-dependent bicarbonate transport family permease [Oceanibaculum sp.]|uniref:sodium-dependent bicarbonate transport family permease n=1 Tax=Oceanibaculum sp. TaxID=1903597 RepID=UPI0025835941|nr:sodium-dependent bicarbonate transport family permease [Oceanibaculum sp.]MCH2396040.1 sodium-dependent bicarbonate transport family permease [Oceanibaculum sp.]
MAVMDALIDAALGNLLSPLVLSFVLGLVAGLVKSDLDMPEVVGKAIAIYLMFAIGLKGGVEMGHAGLGLAILPALLAALILSFGMPYIAYPLLRRLAGADRVNAAAVAAHYGSVSVVTFVAATQMLARDGTGYEGYLVAMLAVMETPAIIAGLLLAGRALALEGGAMAADGGDRRELLREVLANGSVMLLVGGFVIGWLSGSDGYAAVQPFFETPFKGVLCLFLLEMGLLVSRRVSGFQMLRPRLIAFGLYMPLIGASLGLAVAWALGLSVGGGTLLATLAASASYIAVPAAMRLALPQADPALYVTLSLGVTFPFNLIAGLPLYAALARAIL